jgi:hypothetical protein
MVQSCTPVSANVCSIYYVGRQTRILLTYINYYIWSETMQKIRLHAAICRVRFLFRRIQISMHKVVAFQISP